MEIPESELEYSFYRSSGPGGQKKNTTDSAVRLLHLPTGITVTATASRSQYKNKEAALEELIRRLELRRKRKPPRIKTKTPRSVQRRRLESKKQLAQKKALRKPPDP